jgi:hypothetical protein
MFKMFTQPGIIERAIMVFTLDSPHMLCVNIDVRRKADK